ELRNMWTRTDQPGLWFTGGAFSQCRIYSKYLALQIKATELGLMPLAEVATSADLETCAADGEQEAIQAARLS
ncbi:hypothetical protein B0G57_118150, partial [Trinickia symbiotica]